MWVTSHSHQIPLQKRHGHCEVHYKYGPLGIWCNDMRMRGCNPARHEKLTKLGFRWIVSGTNTNCLLLFVFQYLIDKDLKIKSISLPIMFVDTKDDDYSPKDHREENHGRKNDHCISGEIGDLGLFDSYGHSHSFTSTLFLFRTITVTVKCKIVLFHQEPGILINERESA